MSCKLDIKNMTDEAMQRVNTELKIKLEDNKYSFGPPRYIYPYEMINEDVYLPFAYAHRQLRIPRPARDTFPAMDVEFKGKLRPHQAEIKKEAVGYLNKKGSVMISCYTGFGKCLKIDTPILMYNGAIKAVQDIKVGDLLMGDDSTPREVLSTCIGEEQMYDIVPTKGETFGCNESHILSLKISGDKSVIWDKNRDRYFVRWLDRQSLSSKSKYFKEEEEAERFRDTIEGDDTIDITVKDYLALPGSIKHILKLYHVPVSFPEKNLDIDPYLLGVWLGDGTSRDTSITTIDDEIVEYLANISVEMGMKVTVTNDPERAPTYRLVSHDGRVGSNQFRNFLSKYNLIHNKHIPQDFKANSRQNRLLLLAGLIDTDGYLHENCYEITQKRESLATDIAFLARSLGFAVSTKKVCKSCVYKGEKRTGTYHLVAIYGKGLEEIPVLLERKKARPRKQVKDALVSGFKVVPIEDITYYGFVIGGNHRFLLGDFTVTHNTCCGINLSCAVGFKTLVIVHRVVLRKQWEKSLQKFCPDARVQYLTPQSKMKEADFYIMSAINVPKVTRDFFKDIGMVIIDEAHLIMAETLSKCMQYVHPRYLIGLTATPYRVDGLDILLELYFGKYKIIRKLWRKHTAFVVYTNFTPKVEKNAQNRTKWDVVLDSQAKDERRNELIIQLLQLYKERTFLVLVKRVEQGEHLVRRLQQEGEDVTSLLGTNQEFEQTARILVGTNSKVGVGFDHPALDAMVLAADLEQYFIQYLGRCMRTEEVEPIIFDLVDNNPILRKHFDTRRGVYIEHGGIVKTFDMSVLE